MGRTVVVKAKAMATKKAGASLLCRCQSDKKVAPNSSPFAKKPAGPGINPFASSTTRTSRGKDNAAPYPAPKPKQQGQEAFGARSPLGQMLEELEGVEWATLPEEERLRVQGTLLSVASEINATLCSSKTTLQQPKKDEEEVVQVTHDLAEAPVWQVPEAIRNEEDVFKGLDGANLGIPTDDIHKLHAHHVALEDLFPGTGLQALFNGSAQFRQDLRKAMRSDLYIMDPTLSRERNRQMRSLGSTLHVVWNRSACTFRHMDACLKQYGIISLGGGDMIHMLGSLCGGEATSGSLLEIVNIGRRKVNHSWHQDSGRAQRTVMLGFPPCDHYSGGGVFSHAVKLSAELKAQGKRGEVVQYDMYEPYPGDIPEEYVVRPKYEEGKEILVYYDNAHLHATPDVISREAIWRFM